MPLGLPSAHRFLVPACRVPCSHQVLLPEISSSGIFEKSDSIDSSATRDFDLHPIDSRLPTVTPEDDDRHSDEERPPASLQPSKVECSFGLPTTASEARESCTVALQASFHVLIALAKRAQQVLLQHDSTRRKRVIQASRALRAARDFQTELVRTIQRPQRVGSRCRCCRKPPRLLMPQST